MSTQIILYSQGQDEHDINKALTLIGTFDCNLKTPVDAETPEIMINTVNTGANYAYIAQFNRYYYLTPITQHNGITIFRGLSDVLMSFKAGILASPAVIARNPWKYNKYVHDPKLPIEARTARATFRFPNNHFNGSNNCYILTTIGSGS